MNIANTRLIQFNCRRLQPIFWLASAVVLVVCLGCDSHRVQKELWSDGCLRAERTVRPTPNGMWLADGPCITYFEDGKTKAEESMFRDNKLHGKMTQWHPNGQMKSQSTWSEGRLIGTPLEWDEEGKPIDRPAKKPETAATAPADGTQPSTTEGQPPSSEPNAATADPAAATTEPTPETSEPAAATGEPATPATELPSADSPSTEPPAAAADETTEPTSPNR